MDIQHFLTVNVIYVVVVFLLRLSYSWKGCRVTVKELHDQILQHYEERDGLLDLLISEQEYCW